MSKQASPTLIGGFVIGAVALIVAGVLIFGSDKFFTDAIPTVMYFDGDIKGLRAGASVDFQGVQVGRVTNIKAMLDYQNMSVRIPVFVEFTPDRIEAVGELPERGAVLKDLVERGLRAQLQLESIVTGQLFIQLALYPEASPVEVVIDPITQLPEVPTIPTTLQEVQQTVRLALEKLGELPLNEIVSDLRETLQGIEQLVNSSDAQTLIRSLNTTLTNVQQLARSLDERVTPLTSRVTETLDEFRQLAQHIDEQVVTLAARLTDTAKAAQATLDQAQGTLTTVEGFTSQGSPLQYELVTTLRELSRAAGALRALADYLERNPSAVLFGRDETGD